jgi:hypothetical protein
MGPTQPTETNASHFSPFSSHPEPPLGGMQISARLTEACELLLDSKMGKSGEMPGLLPLNGV